MALQNFGIKPIKDFLSDTYLIPDYQREYSWGKEELKIYGTISFILKIILMTNIFLGKLL